MRVIRGLGNIERATAKKEAIQRLMALRFNFRKWNRCLWQVHTDKTECCWSFRKPVQSNREKTQFILRLKLCWLSFSLVRSGAKPHRYELRDLHRQCVPIRYRSIHGRQRKAA